MSRFPARTRAIVMAALASGACTAPREASAPPPAPPPSPRIVIASPPVWRMMEVCVMENGQLRAVMARYSTLTGETRFGEPYPWFLTPLDYAAPAPWYLRDEPITVGGQRYLKFGTSRIVERGDLARAGEYLGVPLFARTDDADPPEILMVPVKHGCEFQPYAREATARGARGG